MNNLFYFIMLIGCVVCAVLCNQADQKPQLMPVTQIQQELVNRGHDIKVDGRFGPNTDLALTKELAK